MKNTAHPHGLNSIAFLVLILFFSCEAKPPPGMTDPGELTYYGFVSKKANCARCHGRDGSGSYDGPDIRGSIEKFGRDRVRDFILNGKDADEDDGMPALRDELSDEQVEKVITFIARWPAPDSSKIRKRKNKHDRRRESP